ncbi:MAG TPA: TIGR03013 family PEP-CTERM/XrtA system glycosyltransferase [Methanophagales archaeon]|nr:TIGR03013 family PEP-CTERM/XrtA system glycosyltransferase [Methanophagales archaeon]
MPTIRLFKHYIQFSYMLLLVVEAMVIGASLEIAIGLRSLVEGEPYYANFSDHIRVSVVFVAIMVLSLFSMGLYHRQLREGFSGMLVRLVVALVAGVLLTKLAFLTFRGLDVYFPFTLAAAFSALGILLSRWLFISLVDLERIKRQVLILGTGKSAALIDNRLRRRTDRRGFHIVDYIHVPTEGDDVIGPANSITLNEPLLRYARRRRVDEIVVALDERRKELPIEELLDCKLAGIGVIELATFFEREASRIELDVRASWIVFSDGFRRGALARAIKRLFDLLISSILIIILMPLMFLTALAIVIESKGRGSLFYRQIRMGEEGRPFNLLKFRSMVENAEKDGIARWSQRNDTWITKVGRFIRRTRLDELPQLWNVLRGDMSFVGPRPERPEFVYDLRKNIPYYQERLRVKPGMTGWAQICYPYGASEKDAFAKLEFDLYYVKNYSVFLDLTILLRTAEVVLLGKGVR